MWPRLILGWLMIWVWQPGTAQKKSDVRQHLQPTVFALTMVMIHDVVNPPAASRFYTYSLLGAHDILARQPQAAITAPTKLIKAFRSPVLDESKPYVPEIAALYCMLESGRLLIPSGSQLIPVQEKLTADLRKQGFSQALLDQSAVVARQEAQAVLRFAAADNYQKLSTAIRYRPSKKPGSWYPTPPGYIEAIEPHWRSIRPVVMDSCTQFRPAPPVPFSTDTTSDFYKLTYEVYAAVNRLSPEQKLIAAYWDCNPFAINTSGHMSIGFKKISPGGHWLNIASLVAEQQRLPFADAVFLHSVVAMTEMDAFISCWDEKYRSDRIRPETVINRHISPRWMPFLQTPPFPEYTSGHSVVSSAVAEVMTYLLGDNVGFLDTTEEIFELPRRRFSSFRQAANEAAISRLYGGIHFRDAIEAGQKQGTAIGLYVVQRLKSAGVAPLAKSKPKPSSR